MDLEKAFKYLGSKISALFTKQKIEEDKRHIEKQQVSKAQLEELMILKQLIGDIDNEDVTKAINVLTEELKKKDLTVNYEPPIVNVPEPKVEVVKETATAKATNKILVEIAQMVAKQLEGGTFITNSEPHEAIPTRLVDKKGKDFYDAVLNAITTGNMPPFVDQNGNPVSATIGLNGEIIIGKERLRIEIDKVSDTLSYVGWAKPGTASSSPTWLIASMDKSGTPSFKFHYANGETTFDKTWDDRASSSY